VKSSRQPSLWAFIYGISTGNNLAVGFLTQNLLPPGQVQKKVLQSLTQVAAEETQIVA
jgi:hypothetical protein